MAKDLKATVLYHRDYGIDYKETVFRVPGMEKPVPGQFVNIKIGEGHDPLLRRPFSIHFYDVQKENLHILYKIVGKGTAILPNLAEGTEVSILGPLGKGFSLEGMRKNSTALLVAGGIGLAPLYYLACQLKEEGKTFQFFIGGRSREDIIARDKIEEITEDPAIFTTEDGSLGSKGLITEAIINYISDSKQEKSSIHLFACGPNPMLRALSSIVDKSEGFPLQVSIESVMACGIGACLGCVCPTPKGDSYKKTCTDGPVFNAGEVSL